jgi:hypothetical protein
VFLPRHVTATLERTKPIYRLYQADHHVRSVEVDSKHDYNLEMREHLYRHVAQYLLNQPRPLISEPDDLPVEDEAELQVGLPADTQTMQSLTYHRASKLTTGIPTPADAVQWSQQKQKMLSRLTDILGAFPSREQCKTTLVRTLTYRSHRVEHWQLVPEPGVVVPAVLCLPQSTAPQRKRPAVIVVDEAGKQQSFERGLVDKLLAAGQIVLAIDLRGTGETAETVPSIAYGPGTPEYNLSNYGLFVGRPISGMRVFDLQCAADFLTQRAEVDASRISLAGRGRGALVCVLAAALDPRIRCLAAEELLASWVFDEEFVEIGLSYLIPRILTVGDMQHLLACAAPRHVLVINPVDGRRRSLQSADPLNQFRFTESVFSVQRDAASFQRQTADLADVPHILAQWLKDAN